MESDTIWQAFAETGDPLYYMLYKEAERKRSAETDSGESPRASD